MRIIKDYSGAALVAAPLILLALQLHAQQPPQGAGAQQAPARGRGAFRGPQPVPFENHDGFTSMFDGSTLKGWDGDPKFWRAEGGALVGETTAENKLTENTFLIWSGGEPSDFDLKLEYRINATNSGVQIRSIHVPSGGSDGHGGTAKGSWVMKGYQADIDFANQYTGQIYEERGRGFLAMRGQFSYITPDAKPNVLGALQTSADELKALIKATDWNQVEVLARGNAIAVFLNGHLTSALIDDDDKGRALKGLIGLQIHMGQPMKAEFRNLWLKQF